MRSFSDLKPEQIEIVKRILSRPRTGVLAPMGMGKTAAVLTAIDFRKLHGDIKGKVLVVAPIRVAQTSWPDEVAQWEHLSHLKIVSVTGGVARRKDSLSQEADIYTINFENLTWLENELKGIWPFEMVVVDENKLKNFRIKQGGVRAKVLARRAFTDIKYFVQLTGTPASNGIQDVWGFHWFIDRGKRLGSSYDAFMQRWFRKQPYGFKWEPMPHAEQEITELIKETCFYLEQDNVDKPIKIDVPVRLPKEAMKSYKAFEKEMFMELEEQLSGEKHLIEAVNPAVKTNKCLQLANGAAYTNPEDRKWVETHTEKLEALRRIISEAEGMPILVAYHFKSDLVRLLDEFPEGRVLDKNPNTIRDWNEGKIPVLFLHPASAGHGLSLQHGGNILVFFSLWWSLEEHLQVIERIGPQRQKQSGYDRPVYVYYIMAEKTMDYVAREKLESKKSVQDILLQALRVYKSTGETTDVR